MSRSPAATLLQRGLPSVGLPLLLLLAACQSDDSAGESSPGSAEQSASPSTPAPAAAQPAPSPGGSDGAAARASTQTAVAPAMAAAPDAGTAAPRAPAPESSFESCIAVAATYDDCEVIHVTVSEAQRCIQLDIDNCSSYGRTGLGAELPPMWRLTSASVRERAEPCELGVFYPDSTIIAAATGGISWDRSTPRPTALEIDVTLEARSVSGTEATYAVATSEPLNPGRCAD